MNADTLIPRIAAIAGELQALIDQAARLPRESPIDHRRRFDLLERLALARDQATLAGQILQETYRVYVLDARPEVFEVPAAAGGAR